MKIPLSGSVAGFAGDIACSTFTTSSSKPLPFRFDGFATSISLTEAAGLVSGSGCNTNRKPQSGASAKWKKSSGYLALLERRDEDAVRPPRQQAGEVGLAQGQRQAAQVIAVEREDVGPPSGAVLAVAGTCQ